MIKHFLRVRHPSALVGNFAIDWRGRTVRGEISEGVLDVTDDMGGAELVRHLVQAEGWKDLSQYPPGPLGPLSHEDRSNAWDLEIPYANYERPHNGTLGVSVRGHDLSMPVINNVVYVLDKPMAWSEPNENGDRQVRVTGRDVRNELLRDGWKVVRSHEDVVRADISRRTKEEARNREEKGNREKRTAAAESFAPEPATVA